MKFDLLAMERQLEAKGISSGVRNEIRNARICIVDDQLDHLQSFMDGLRSEGFTNLVQMTRVNSIHDLLSSGFELIVLDLSGVAKEIADDDGVGVLKLLKKAEPALPILVVTGSTLSPDRASTLAMADAIRMKPILPADLAQEVEDLLKYRKDGYWASLAILKELRRIKPELSGELGVVGRMRLAVLQGQLERSLRDRDPGIVHKIAKVASVVSSTGTIVLKIVELAKAVSPS